MSADSTRRQSAASYNTAPPPLAAGESAMGATFLDDALCVDCGYSLRGLTSARCPECGADLERLRSPESRIPWVQRRARGRFLAYWQTVFFFMFRSRWFRAEMVRAVSFRDAQRFRWTIVLQAWGAMLAALLAASVTAPGLLDHPISFYGPAAGVTFLIGVLVFLAGLTGLPSYFFHPRGFPVDLQNRAVALSYYTCAPLAIFPLIAGLAVLSSCLTDRGSPSPREVAGALAIVLVPAMLLAWWLDALRLAREIFHSGGRGWYVGLVLPLAALGLAAATLIVLPLSVAYVEFLLRLL